MISEPEISVVVPMLNEEPNVRPLVNEVRDALRDHDWELVVVDDGSDDGTDRAVRRCLEEDQRIRLVSLARSYGQSTAMQAGFDHARGKVLITMDGDLQNDPRDIPLLVKELEKGYDLVAGYREARQDLLITRKVPSWIANRVIAWVTGVPIRDNGCSLKAYRRDLLDRLRLYSDMHRFIPALAAGTSGARIAEIPVRHHPRLRGESKYGLSRVGKVLVDLVTVKMVRSFRSRPLRLFAGGAVLAALLATFFGAATLVAQAHFTAYKARSVVFAGTSLVWLALSLFLLMLGLVGQVAVGERHRKGRAMPPILHEVEM